MFELVSGTPPPQFGEESSRIRADSRFKQVLCFNLIDARYFSLCPEIFFVTLRVFVPRLKTVAINDLILTTFAMCIHITVNAVF
jgi:hypothetical protein